MTNSQQAAQNRRRFLTGLAAGATATGAALAVSSAQAQLPAPAARQIAAAGVNFRDIQAHENAHVNQLLSVLGSNARPRPTFRNLRQSSENAFFTVSAAFENTGVAAYLGATPYVQSQAYLSAAASIALIEARHSGWLNSLLARRITTNAAGDPQNFEGTFSQQVIVNAVTPYIQSLNGPPLSYTTTKSAQNDLDILNFALALEYLEQDFYNINVPIYFPAS